MQTEIYDLNSTSPKAMAIFENDLDSVENLITQYILDFYGQTQIHNEGLRAKLKARIVFGAKTAALDFYAVKLA